MRELARATLGGCARKGRRYVFSFRDLVVLRAARELLQDQVPAARVRRALAKLGEQLEGDRALSELRLFAEGRSVAVRQGGLAWDAETGQTLLDFELRELQERMNEIPGEPGGAPGGAPSRDRARSEFERGLELEDRDPEAAAKAYARAIEADPDLVEAYVNYGRILHESGDATGAARLYRQALALAPDDPLLHFNLALALEDADGPGPAAAHYEQALELDPLFADAHYNLAGLCERLGRSAEALRHYHAYKKLTEG